MASSMRPSSRTSCSVSCRSQKSSAQSPPRERAVRRARSASRADTTGVRVIVSVLLMPSPLVAADGGGGMVRRLVADDSDRDVTIARSVVLREVDALPCAEQELAGMYREAYVVAGQHGFDVRVGISLSVVELLFARHELSEV